MRLHVTRVGRDGCSRNTPPTRIQLLLAAGNIGWNLASTRKEPDLDARVFGPFGCEDAAVVCVEAAAVGLCVAGLHTTA
jgi:hypothetical protein